LEDVREGLVNEHENVAHLIEELHRKDHSNRPLPLGLPQAASIGSKIRLTGGLYFWQKTSPPHRYK